MPFVLTERASGVLLHPTSLPGPFACGDLGPQAHLFAQFLYRAGQRVWQLLPIGPLGYGNSPYSALSAFAGEPLLVSLQRLVEEGLLPQGALDGAPAIRPGRVDYAGARAFHEHCVGIAFEAFQKRTSDHAPFESFCQANRDWLEDHALFTAIKRARRNVAWTDWEPELRGRDAGALDRARSALRRELDRHRFEQFLFDRHWRTLKDRCHSLGIALVGDAPIFVAHDSADVWAHPELFWLDPHGQPTVIAGVPPDYFSATGQRWGNPLYRWDVLARSDYRWWVQRFAVLLERFDALRLDHFIGFTRAWEIAASEPTAANGRWVPGPGPALFERVRAALGALPLIAEDLGAVTPEVLALRDRFGLPGIKLLQFAFGTDAQAPSFLPHNYPRNAVAYTGTHDNDTTLGWFYEKESPSRSAAQCELERRAALEYTAGPGNRPREVHWELLRCVWASVANLAIAPAQDLLGLGSEARMNLPGTAQGNWEWRLREGQLDAPIADRLRELTRIYGRLPGGTS